MKKKLTLHRETLRLLSTPGLGQVRGGTIIEPTGATYCIICGTGSCNDCPGPKTDEVTVCVCEI